MVELTMVNYSFWKLCEDILPNEFMSKKPQIVWSQTSSRLNFKLFADDT